MCHPERTYLAYSSTWERRVEGSAFRDVSHNNRLPRSPSSSRKDSGAKAEQNQGFSNHLHYCQQLVRLICSREQCQHYCCSGRDETHQAETDCDRRFSWHPPHIRP